MKLHDLQPAPGSTRKRTRKGRGIAAGQGKTAGRGTKGQRARAGRGISLYFEGGQLPLSRRLPQLPGFNNKFRQAYEAVNLDSLNERFENGAEVTLEALREHGLVKKGKRVKVLGRGDLAKALTVSAHAFSASAREKIKAAGGQVQEIAWERPPRVIR